MAAAVLLVAVFPANVQMAVDAVQDRFGRYGARVWRRARGEAPTHLAARTPPPDLAAEVAFEQAVAEYRVDPDFTLLGLDEAQSVAFFADAWTLVEAYFAMEDPTTVRDIGLELRLEAQVGSLALRGIIDRLELDALHGPSLWLRYFHDPDELAAYEFRCGLATLTPELLARRYGAWGQLEQQLSE